MAHNMAENLDQKVIRRAQLVALLKEKYPKTSGILIFCAAFETTRDAFYQDSTFSYFVGLNEPGIVVTQEINSNTAILHEPKYKIKRSIWLPETYNDAFLEKFNIIQKQFLGDFVPGYSIDLFTSIQAYDAFIEMLKAVVDRGDHIFVSMTDVSPECAVVMQRILALIPGSDKACIDISSCIAQLRRKKEQAEIELMYRAVEITAMAQEGAAGMIAPLKTEAEMQAVIEYVFTGNQATRSFSSIVGAGKNSTILHYVSNSGVLEKGDLVVIDIGASYMHYCADLTRTYPISGKFTARQREIYTIVLHVQEHIAAIAKPGMWLNNADVPDQSLHHIAHALMKEKGYGAYFPHGIGHFVGLDVHDVGDSKVALAEGDVITIEPGIYIPEEKLGVRIEDMYWMIQGGAVCLSEGLPKTADEIEALMRDCAV